MDKVEAYRCEDCKGKGYYEIRGETGGEAALRTFTCNTCDGEKKVWLTEEEGKEW